MLCVILNKSIYGHLTPIQVRWTRHEGYSCRNKNEFKRRFLWSLTHRRTSVGQPSKTYQLCVNTGCRIDDLISTIADRDGCREKFKGVHAVGTLWWWSFQDCFRLRECQWLCSRWYPIQPQKQKSCTPEVKVDTVGWYNYSSHRSISSRESMPPSSDSAIHWPIRGRAHWFLLPLLNYFF